MRITVSHNKGQQEAIRIVNEASDQFLKPDLPGAFRMMDVKKSWSGNAMKFSIEAKAGFISLPLNGVITVNEKDVTIDCELPAFLTKLMPESKIRAGVENKVKGLLT